MTREQYEKLKEWIVANTMHAIVRTQHTKNEVIQTEKELDKLMEDSFKAQELMVGGK